MARFWRRGHGKTGIEDALRAARPEAPERLVDRLVRRIETRDRRPAGLRGALRAGLLTAGVLGALAAVGGLGYFASLTLQVADKTGSRVVNLRNARNQVVQQVQNAALAQYATTTSGGGGGGGGAPATTTTTTTATTTTAGTTTTASTGSTGTVAVTTPSGGSVSVSWGGSSLPVPATISVNPTPTVPGITVGGGLNKYVSVTITNSQTGAPIHQLAAPIDITFTNPPAGFRPAVSEDGVHFRQLARISGPPLPASMQDAYYVDSAGNIHILTRHVTIFAVVYSANIAVSESGRLTPPAGSGKFGDPTRNQPGAPKMHKVGTGAITSSAGKVPVTFFVNEQASIHVSVLDAAGNQIVLLQKGSVLRGHGLKGPATKNVHVVILRPGTIKLTMRAPAHLLKAGQRYRLQIRAIDFDGHHTVLNIPFTAG